MVARVLFPVLTWRGNAITPPAPGDHKGPPFPASSTLAPTDHPASCLASRLRLMPSGRGQAPLYFVRLGTGSGGPISISTLYHFVYRDYCECIDGFVPVR